jgi:hypothetical protein
MGKIIKLRESDLNRIVKKVLKEQNQIEIDPTDLEMPDEENLRKIFTGEVQMSDEMMGKTREFKKHMKACIKEKNLYKMEGFLNNLENKKMNVMNTLLANIVDKGLGGKTLFQEFNELSDCVNSKRYEK